MSGFTIAVLFSPRYLMIAAFAVLAIVFLTPELASNPQIDFETILPTAIATFLPAGLKGLLLAGLMAAFMGTFAAVINAAPAYIANDLLKNSLLPGKTEKTYVRYGYLSSFLLVLIGVFFGFFATSLNAITLWITASLYGGYTAANVLKWVWWRLRSCCLGCVELPCSCCELAVSASCSTVVMFKDGGCCIGTLIGVTVLFAPSSSASVAAGGVGGGDEGGEETLFARRVRSANECTTPFFPTASRA